MNNYKFLGQEFFAYDSYYPRGCFRHKHKRTLIAITPSNEITNAIQRNIYIWSKLSLALMVFSGSLEDQNGLFYCPKSKDFQ